MVVASRGFGCYADGSSLPSTCVTANEGFTMPGLPGFFFGACEAMA